MNDLMVLPAAQLPRLSFTDYAIQLRDDALAASALIAKVDSEIAQQEATEAQKRLYSVLRGVEDARKQIKAPVLDLGREIDKAAAGFTSEAQEEFNRVGKLIADYAALLLAKQRAAEAAARLEQERIERERLKQEEEERQRIERERQAALAAAKDHDDLDRINLEASEAQRLAQERLAEEAAARAAVALAAIPQAPEVKGSVVRQDWEFEVTDLGALARNHPSCVEIKPRRSEIKALLRQGVKVVGVRAWVDTKASVRLDKPQLVEA